jgi:membrane protein
VRGSLTRMTGQRGTGLTVLIVGSVLALWSLTGAMQNVMWGAKIAYGREETRGFVRRRLTALVMVAFWLLAFALAFGVLVLGPHLSSWIGSGVGERKLVETAWWVGEWPLLVLGLALAFAALMFLAPNVKHPRWHFVTLGAVVTIVVWLAASGAFAFYVSRFGSYNKAWGALAAVVIMLAWLWLSSAALLLGIETNAEALRSRELRQGLPAEADIQAPAKA